MDEQTRTVLTHFAQDFADDWPEVAAAIRAVLAENERLREHGAKECEAVIDLQAALTAAQQQIERLTRDLGAVESRATAAENEMRRQVGFANERLAAERQAREATEQEAKRLQSSLNQSVAIAAERYERAEAAVRALDMIERELAMTPAGDRLRRIIRAARARAEGKPQRDPSFNDADSRHGGYGHICDENCEIWRSEPARAAREPGAQGPVAQLADLLKAAGVEPCICFVCKHQPSYGPCAKCGCDNATAPARAVLAEAERNNG